MRKPSFILVILFTLSVVIGCQPRKPSADHVYHNGVVYTVDDSFRVATAFAIKDGIIIDVGTDDEMLAYDAQEKTDLKGQSVFPGFHDGHCHFYGYGLDLKKISLVGTSSFDAILDTLSKYRQQLSGGWLFGRGWDQNDWSDQSYPNNAQLDSLFPDIPVFLLRIDGHAALVNTMAMNLAGIDANTKVIGGEVQLSNGKPTGLLVDAAVELVQEKIPQPSKSETIEALLSAQKNCFAVGLTMVTDAGIGNGGIMLNILQTIDSMQSSKSLAMRINAMGSILEIEKYRNKKKIWSDFLQVNGFKVYGDGALGSRGALMKKPYSDQPGHVGFLIHDAKKLDSIASAIAAIGYQMNTHCIGDSAHVLALNIYKKHTAKMQDHRWRIEHAQVIDTNDISLYENSGIIPSVQPVHATSDMYWAEKRLGKDRMAGAYAYQDLLKSSGIMIAGSDFPVEHINPLFGFYAAVVRKDQKDFPEGGFLPRQKLSREDALRSMTIWPAYGAFMEQKLGSIEKGKLADFVILEKDIMKIPEKEIWSVQVVATYIGGKKVFGRER
ncbi:MAG: amidohydrolase [Bacteroidia bacterium]